MRGFAQTTSGDLFVHSSQSLSRANPIDCATFNALHPHGRRFDEIEVFAVERANIIDRPGHRIRRHGFGYSNGTAVKHRQGFVLVAALLRAS